MNSIINIEKRNIMENWIKQQGVFVTEEATPLQDEIAEKIMLQALKVCPNVFARNFVYWYLYRKAHQPNANRDGEMWYYTTESGDTLRAIGISLESIEKGTEYAALIILHEIAHIFIECPSEPTVHTDKFHNFLDGLIAKYNKAYGTSIQNDYIK